jgi:hypothetical protein
MPPIAAIGRVDPQRKSGGQTCGDAQRFSLSDPFARSTEFCRKIFKLWQAVAHGQNGLGIIDVDTRIECESWKTYGASSSSYAARPIGGSPCAA